MSNRLVNEGQIRQFKDYVRQIREDIGRNVILHLSATKVRCPNCLWSPIDHKSTNIYSPKLIPTGIKGYNGASVATPFTGGLCPWCNGTGQVPQTEITKIVKCLVRWLNTGEERYLVQGIMAENDVRLKADIVYKNDFLNSRIVEIDGSPFQVKQIVPAGLRDLSYVKVFLQQSPWPAGKKKDVGQF